MRQPNLPALDLSPLHIRIHTKSHIKPPSSSTDPPLPPLPISYLFSPTGGAHGR